MTMNELHSQPTMTRSRTDPEKYLEFEEPHSAREFVSIKNLDTYFTDIYDYHRQGGYCSIIYSKISNLITIAFTIVFSVFLVGFIDWKAVISCGNEDSECKNVRLIKNNITSNKTFGAIVIIYTIVFAMYLIWHLLHFIFVSLSSLAVTRQFYHEKLKISEETLRRIEWPNVMHAIVSLQERSVLLYHNKHLDTLDITNRILRQENYMIAFVHKGVLSFNMPKLNIWKRIRNNKDRRKYMYVDEIENEDNKLLFDDDDYKEKQEEAPNDEGFLSAVLLWNMKYIIFQAMFDDEMKIKHSFKSASGSSNLKWKCFWFGVGNLLLCPFTFVFRIIFFFLQNAEEMQRSNNKSYVLSFRQWTNLAKLKFREFNELPHDFEKRMNLSIQPSTEYIESLWKPPHVLVLSELISYISGSIVAVLLLLTAIDSSILLNIELFGRSLVWFLAIFSALLAFARSNIVYNDPSQNYEEQMTRISKHTHYFPRHWQSECHRPFVGNEFMSLYQPKLNLFINELLSCFATPFILMFTLPNCLDELVEFVIEHSEYIDGVGAICSYSRFTHNIKPVPKQQELQDIKLLGAIENNTRQISNVSNVSSNSDTSFSAPPSASSTIALKLESSFLTFRANNPNWRNIQSISQSALKHIAENQNASTAQLGLTLSQLLSSEMNHQSSHQQMLSEINESNNAPYKTINEA
eukprot:308916_1